MKIHAVNSDLVELRCKLRGWTLEAESIGLPTGDIHAIWHAPRMTLADIVADPGQGWRVERVNAGLVRFHFDDALISVEWRKGRIHETWLRTWALNMDQRLAAHRAVTGLLIKLGEVSDG